MIYDSFLKKIFDFFLRRPETPVCSSADLYFRTISYLEGVLAQRTRRGHKRLDRNNRVQPQMK